MGCCHYTKAAARPKPQHYLDKGAIHPSGWGWAGGPTALMQGEMGGGEERHSTPSAPPPPPPRTRYLPNVLTKQQLRPTPSRDSSSPRSAGKSPLLASTLARDYFPHNVTKRHVHPLTFHPSPPRQQQTQIHHPLHLPQHQISRAKEASLFPSHLTGAPPPCVAEVEELAPPAGGVVLRGLAFPEV